MKTEQIKFENNRLELAVKRPTHFVTIFLVSAATLCIIAPLIIFANLMFQSQKGFRIETMTVVLSLIPIVFGLFLLRMFIWNFYGKEVYSFENEKLEFWSDFKFFKTEKKSFKIKDVNFSTEHSGFENERKSVLIIETKKFKHKSKVELPEKEADHLIELLNQKLNQNKQ